MQKLQQAHVLYDRIISKGQKGIDELDVYLQTFLKHELNKQRQNIESLVNYCMDKLKILTNENNKVLVTEALECITYQIKETRRYQDVCDKIIFFIIKMVVDQSQKVKFCAIGVVFNFFNILEDDNLRFFITTFKNLTILICDESPRIRQAATFLNQALKRTLNDAIFDHKQFDIEKFMKILADELSVDKALCKQFVIDWIMSLEEITSFEVSFYLQLFFKEMFELSMCENKNLKNKADECIKKFLHVFKETYAKKKGDLSSKLTKENAKLLIEMILLLIRQNLSFEIVFHALEWLEVFTKFFSQQVKNQHKQFLQPVFFNFARNILVVVISSLSDDSERIRKIALRINEHLITTFPYMSIKSSNFNYSIEILIKMLKQTQSFINVEAILKWIKIFFQQCKENTPESVSNLVETIVEKLCDRNVTKNTFLLLQKSVFTEKHFQLLIDKVFWFMKQNDIVNQQSVFRQIIHLERSQQNFLMICKKTKMIEDIKFQYSIVQHLLNILITDNILKNLRLKIVKKEDPQLFSMLMSNFINNQAAVLLLLFLARRYYFVEKFIEYLTANELVSGAMLKSMLKMVNLIQSSNLNHIRCDFKSDYHARKAFLEYIMVIPYGKICQAMMDRVLFSKEFEIKLDQIQVDPPEQKQILSFFDKIKSQKESIKLIKNDQS